MCLMPMQHPNSPVIWLCTDCPHAGLTGSWLIHKRCASQRIGLVAASPTLHTQWRRSPRIASKTKRLHKITAAHFTLPMTPGRRHVLDGATRAIIVTKSFPRGWHSAQLARRFFTQKHCASQQREDYAEVSRAEPLSNVAFILASFWSSQFSFANNSKGL